MKRIFSFLCVLCCASMMGWAVQYCDYPTGHLNDANFGDANGRILLTLVPTGNANEYQLTIKPNTDNGNVKKLDYLYAIIGDGGTTTPYPIEAGTDESSVEDELSATFTYTGGANTMTIQWSYPDWAGRWQCTLDNINLSALENCTGGGGGDPTPDPDPEPEPDPNSYTAGGHTIHLDASYVDDIYTLVISSTDNMEGLGGSFWYVNGVGADMRTNAGTSSYTVSGDKKTITCQVQSSSAPNIYTPLFVMMPGEVNFGNVILNWEDRTPITSEYCNYQDPQTIKGGKNIALTWETDGNGNVIITMQNGTGASSCSFRNGGFEGGIGAFVVSDDNFVTTTPASDYFTAVQVYSGNTYTLTKIADLPANAKIKHVGSGHALAWVLDGNNEYCFPDFIYTYGGTCNQLDAPANVAIDANNILTFDAVTGADSYMAYVSLGGVEKYSQAVASGDELTYTALVTGDYIINVVASGAGKVDSDPSADVIWHLEAAPVVLGNSEYCETHKSSGNTEAAFTWETDADGNIVITISEVLSGSNDPAHFRANAFKDGIKVGASKESLSTYFNIPATIANADHSNNSLTYTLIDPANAPSLGEKIYYHGVVEYRTSENTDAWPTLDFEWTYGTVCSGKAVSATSNNNTMGSAVVKVGDDEVTNVDEGTEVTFIATSADPAIYRFVNWTKGGVEVSTSATYAMTITETTNLVANFDYVRTTYCHSEVLTNNDKTLYLSVSKVADNTYKIRIDGSAEARINGRNNFNFVINHTTNYSNAAYDEATGLGWKVSNEGNGYIENTFSAPDYKALTFGSHYFAIGAQGGGEFVLDNNFPVANTIAWNSTCVDPEAPVIAKAEAEVLNESSVRLTIQATDNWGGLLTYTIARADADDIVSNHASGEEFTQDVDGLTAGTEYTFTVTVSDGVHDASQNIVVTPIADNVKPVMSSASLESKTWNSAIISVAATDNKGVTAYYVVEKDAEYVAAEGKITIEGLTAATAYTFTIKAKDAAGNISDNSSEVVFTTDAHSLAPTTAAPVPTWPANQVKSLYSDTYDLAPAHTPNYNAPWWSAPAITLADIDGNHYMDYNLANDGMIGWQYDQISVATMEKLHIDIYASAAGTVSVRPITEGDGALNDNRKSLTLVAQQWNSFDIELTEFGAHDWTKLFQFSIEYWAAGGLLGEHISVDNVYFYRTTALVDNEKPTNVRANVAKASFGSITLTVSGEDNSGTVLYSIKIGDTEYANGAVASGTSKSFTLNGLAPGTSYNISVIASDESGNEADPVIVAAQTNAITPAPAPTHNAGLVLSVYSDKYESALAHDFLKNTWTGIPYTELNLGGDNVLAYINPNMPNQMPDISWGENNDGGNAIIAKAGLNDGTNKGLDVRNMQYIHFDIWSSVATTYPELRLNDTPAGNIVLDGSGWQSFDLDISTLTDAQRSNIRWIKFIAFRNPAPEDIVIDNVYFWSYGVTTTSVMGGDDATGGWATFACAENIQLPNGISAYKAVYSNEGNDEVLNLTKLSDGIIPANAGVVLHGTAGETFTFSLTDATPVTDMSDNMLVGCAVRTDISGVAASNDIFCMRYSELFGITGFFLYTGQYIPAGKAYLPVPKDPGAAPVSRRVRFVFNNENVATGVEQEANMQTTVCHKVIENGRLIIIRNGIRYTAEGLRVE